MSAHVGTGNVHIPRGYERLSEYMNIVRAYIRTIDKTGVGSHVPLRTRANLKDDRATGVGGGSRKPHDPEPLGYQTEYQGFQGNG
jgi:hypothetical protein